MKEFPEFLAKNELRNVDIQVPEGEVLTNVTRPSLLGDMVVKAQVPVTGRGLKGGIRFAENAADAEMIASELLGCEIDGKVVDTLLVEETVVAENELYLAFSADGRLTEPELIFSPQGGSEIGTVPDEAVGRVSVNPLLGIQSYQVRSLVEQVGGNDIEARELIPVISGLWNVFRKRDLRLAEINPLGKVGEEYIAMDAKFVVDESALYRQNEKSLDSTLTQLEFEAETDGVYLREGTGNIGILSTGAGLGMSTLDLLAIDGESFAGFVDTRGAEFKQNMVKKFLEYLEKAESEVIIVNIFGSFVDCSEVAEELAVVIDSGYEIPIVCRFNGTNQDAASKIAHEAGMLTYNQVKDATNMAREILVERGGDY